MSTLSSFRGSCHRLIDAETELCKILPAACQVEATKEVFRDMQEEALGNYHERALMAYLNWHECYEEVRTFCNKDGSGWGEVKKYPDMIFRGFYEAVADEYDFKYNTFVGVMASLGIYTIYDDRDCWKGQKDGHKPSYNRHKAEASIASQIEKPYILPNTEMGKFFITVLDLTAQTIGVNKPYSETAGTIWPQLQNWHVIANSEYAKNLVANPMKLFDGTKYVAFQAKFAQWMSETRVYWFYLLHDQIQQAGFQANSDREAGEQDTRPNVAILYPTPQPSQPKKPRSWWLRW